jgi:microcystin-dependent protein
MAVPFVGEIRMFGGTFAPVDWAFCSGQLLSIADQDELYTLIGTTYGGDGQTTFALPDLSSRVPVHQGPEFALGQQAGAEAVTLNSSQLPAHTHLGVATSDSGTATDPAGGVWASTPQLPYGAFAEPETTMAASEVSNTGGGQPHNNMLPFLAVNFIIALSGTFPTQS